MKKIRPHFIFIALLAMVVSILPGQDTAQEPVEKPGSSGTDIFLVLDNSGSMKTNDPKNLTREVVRNFINRLGQSQSNRLGMVIFDSKANLTQPLTQLTGTADRDVFLKSLEKVDYRGKWTNIPAAMERAIYELKTTGRPNAIKIIVFLTDGIVDTGNKTNDAEKLKWLKNELAQDSKQAGVRIFGIAFTEDADFSLIQSLAVKTGGQYYRAFKAEDIQGVFNRIEAEIESVKQKLAAEAQRKIDEEKKKKKSEALAAKKLNPTAPQPVTGKPAPESKSPLPLPVIIGGGLALLLLIILLLTRKSKSGSKGENGSQQFVPMPQAKLIDQQAEFFKQPVMLTKSYLTIGRAPENDIRLPRETISAFHATIKYANNGFYLEDQRSSNFTKLNGKKIAVNKPMLLKSGDLITIDVYEFQFILPHVEASGRTIIQKSTIGDGSRTIMRDAPTPNPFFDTDDEPGALETVDITSGDTPGGTPGYAPPPPPAPQDAMPDTQREAQNETTFEPTIVPPGNSSRKPFEPTVMDMESYSEDAPPPPEPGTLIESPDSDATRFEPLNIHGTPPPVEKKGDIADPCPNHPERNATDLCLRCKKGFCKDCVTKVDGRFLCPDCAEHKKEITNDQIPG